MKTERIRKSVLSFLGAALMGLCLTPGFSQGARADDRRVFAETDLVDGRVAVLRQGKRNNFLLKAV